MNTNDKLDDWVLVPIYPTQPMRDAGNAEIRRCSDEPGMGVADRAFYAYGAMLAAAPAPAVEAPTGTPPRAWTEQERQDAQDAMRKIVDSELRLIDERDHAHDIIDNLCDAVLGPDRQEWSSAYFFENAVEDVEEEIARLKKQAPTVDGDGNMRNVIEAAFNLSMHVNIPEITPNIDGTITFEWETDAGAALMELSHDSYSFLMKTKKGERFTDTGRLDSAANIEALGANIQSALYQNLSVGGDVAAPDGYAYRYPDGCIRHNDGRSVNGIEPIEAIPYYYGKPPATQGDAISPCLGCDSLACDDCRRRVINESEVAMDAERYRWLRDKAGFGSRHDPAVLKDGPTDCCEFMFGEELDAAIDEAIAAQAGGEG